MTFHDFSQVFETHQQAPLRANHEIRLGRVTQRAGMVDPASQVDNGGPVAKWAVRFVAKMHMC